MISLTQTLALAALLLGAVDGRSTRSYDPAGTLLTTVDAGGHATTFAVDASGQVTAKTGPQRDEAWTFEYDVFGQLKKKALVRGSGALAGWKGAVWSYEYGLTDGTTVKETGPDGYTTSRWYNARHQLLKEVRTDVGSSRSSSNEWVMTQEWSGPYLKTRTEKEGAWTKTLSRPSYDHRGRVLEEKEEFVGVEGSTGYTYTTYTPWSGRTASVQQSWATQTVTGSRSGSVSIDGLGNTIEQAWGVYNDTWQYDAAGRLVSETLGGKPERSLHYVEGLADQETYGSVETTSYQYWASGKPWTRSDPDGRERRLTWNERGLLAKEEYGRGGSYDTRQYGYDAGGARASMTVGSGAEQAAWAYQNGPRGELLSVTQPGGNGGTFQYEYDERTQLARVTPPAGSASASQTFDYDYLGRQVSRTRGDATWTTSWSSGGGTTLEPADPLPGAVRTVYRSLDGRGREAVVSWSGVPSELTQVARQYGPHDGPLGVTEYRSAGNVEVSYAYDARFLVTSVSRGLDSVTYGYTASGERSWEQSPAGRTDYDYDGLDRLWHATSSRGSTEFVWEDGGTRLLAVKAPGVTECRGYDAQGRLTWMDGRDPGVPCDSPAAAPIVRFDYGYDERGNRTSETYQSQGATEPPTQYGYDAADRLTSVVSPNGAETTYGLLGDGSRNTVTTAPTQGGLRTTESYHYDARGGLTGITDEANQAVATYTVDVAGRVLSEARGTRSRSFTWDAGGRLTVASVTVSGTTAASSYGYDHAGLRIRKQGPAGTTTYLWGAGELAEEVLPTGTRLRYERGAGLALAVGGETLLHDGLGSVVGRVGAGAPVMYRYDAWGSFTGSAGPGSGEPSLAYAGQHWDADAGLSYAQQRWYSPEVGRFLSEDPVFGELARPNSLHAFGYANFNPLSYTDPSGEAARLFRQDIEKLSRSEKEAAARLVSPFWSLSASAAALQRLGDEQVVNAVCGEVDCGDGAVAYGWERAGRWSEANVQPVLDQIASSPAADAIRAAQDKASEIDASLRDTATGTYRQALGPTVNAIASSNMRPADAAPQVLAQTQAMSRNLGDATVDLAYEGASGLALGGVLKARGLRAGAAEVGVASAESRLIRLENRGRVLFSGREVRAVRNLSHVPESTLREMAEAGFAAKDKKGRKLVLHHLGQNPDGVIVEIPAKDHRIANRVQHPRGNAPGVGLTSEEREAFNTWRSDYWKARAREELAARGLAE